MTGILALLFRSIRSDAVKRVPHAFRIGSVLIILISLVIAQRTPSAADAPGLEFFRYITWLQIGLITLAGTGHFATAIAEEREEGTLVLLLLADISPLSILLGKSTNRVLSAMLIFAAQLPFALLALTLGGISVQQILYVYLVLSAYLFFLAQLALAVSVVCRRTGEALAAMGVLTLLLFGGVPYLKGLSSGLVSHRYIQDDSWIAQGIDRVVVAEGYVSPVLVAERILKINYDGGFPLGQISCSILGGLLLFLLAWTCFRRVIWIADQHSVREIPTSAQSGWKGLVAVGRTWVWAVPWKDYYFLGGGTTVVASKIILILLALLIGWLFQQPLADLSQLTVASFGLSFLLLMGLIELIVFSSQLFNSEMRQGTLPTLLMLPTSVGKLSYQKLGGCALSCWPTWLGILLFYVADEGAPGLFELTNSLWYSGALVLVLVICHLTVQCSLIVKWGALPLAAAILLVGWFIISPFINLGVEIATEHYGENFVQSGPVIYLGAITCGALQILIGRTVKSVAAR